MQQFQRLCVEGRMTVLARHAGEAVVELMRCAETDTVDLSLLW